MMKSELRHPKIPPPPALETAPTAPRRVDARLALHPQPLWDEPALRAAEAHWSAVLGPQRLMQRAGCALAGLLRARWPHARRVLLLCGPGNNGGDGLVAAACLASLPNPPRLHAVLVGCGEPSQWNASLRPADWCAALAQAQAAGVQPRAWDGVELAALLRDADVVVDALLGLGLRQAPRGDVAQAIELLDDAARAAFPEFRPRVLAADLPSGLSGASGSAPGRCVRADVTLAMLGLQPGHVTGPQAAACGELWVHDLGADPQAAAVAPVATWGGVWQALRALPRLELAAHKGARGDVRLLGGGPGMAGALALAARAALRLGAGRVYAAALDPRGAAFDPQYPELMARDPGQLLEQARAADGRGACLVFGPGAGESAQALRCLLDALALPQPLVLDADGLNLLAAQPRDGAAWSALRARRHATWLTPHPTEAARLLQTSTSDVQADRLGAARRLATLTAAHIVLKGAGSVIAAPDGALRVNGSGNGLLASAGTGDVLAGALGACLAAGDAAPEAAWAAVWLHGAGADLALREGAELRADLLAGCMLRALHDARAGATR